MKARIAIVVLALTVCAGASAYAQAQQATTDGKPSHHREFKTNGPVVVDAKGKTVGPIMGTLPGGQAQYVLLTVNGVDVEVLVSAQGFLDEATTGGYTTGFFEFFTGANCNGTPLVAMGLSQDINQSSGTSPLVQVPQPNVSGSISTGPYVYNQTLYYADPTIVATTAVSGQNLPDPTFSKFPAGPCTPSDLQAPLGSLETFDLKTLNLTPPFTVKP